MILRALQLGDLLTAVPAFRAIRATFPSADVTLLGLPWAHDFVERFDLYLDRFLELPGFPGLPEASADPGRISTLLAHATAQRYDLALQMHGDGGVTNVLVSLLGARQVAGHTSPHAYCPDPERFFPYPTQLPEVQRHLALLESLGIEPAGDHLEFPLSESDRRELADIPEAAVVRGRRYACIHPGARAAERRWSPAGFADVADRLAEDGLEIVLTGTDHDRPLAREVRRLMTHDAIDLAGRTRLGALASLVADAALLCCNDTGVSHLADALGVPSVVVFTGSERARWAPLDTRLHRAVDGHATMSVERAAGQARDLLRQVA